MKHTSISLTVPLWDHSLGTAMFIRWIETHYVITRGNLAIWCTEIRNKREAAAYLLFDGNQEVWSAADICYAWLQIVSRHSGYCVSRYLGQKLQFVLNTVSDADWNRRREERFLPYENFSLPFYKTFRWQHQTSEHLVFAKDKILQKQTFGWREIGIGEI